MADARISVVDGKAVVAPFGADLLIPLVARAEAAATAVSDLNPQSGRNIYCDMLLSGVYLRMTPKTGFSVLSAGLNQIFCGVMPTPPEAGTLYLIVDGLNDADPRLVKQDGDNIAPAALPAGTFVAFKFLVATGTFQLIWPTLIPDIPTPEPAVKPYYVVLEQTGGTANDLILTPTTPLPNNTGENLTFRVQLPTKAEGSVTVRVVGINDADAWYLLGPPGDPEADQLAAADVYSSDDEIEFSRKGSDPTWVVKRIINPTLAKLDEPAPADPGLRSFYAQMNSRIHALSSFGK